MNNGKMLFAQLMDFLPWSTFTRLVTRYGGDHGVRTLSCAEQYRAMAFAQLTYRESLRDIEACLSAQASKLYHMGFRERVRRSTLADANEARDWRIYAEFAQRLIAQARKLYASESLGIELTNTVYALDATTIDLCLSVFPWAHFRSAKAAVKMHTLLDLRGNIPTFIHISDGKMHDVRARRTGGGAVGAHTWMETFLSPVYRDMLQTLTTTGYQLATAVKGKDGLLKFLTGIAEMRGDAFPGFRDPP